MRRVVAADAVDPLDLEHIRYAGDRNIGHRHQRLPAGEKLGVFACRQQADDLADGARIAIGEGS